MPANALLLMLSTLAGTPGQAEDGNAPDAFVSRTHVSIPKQAGDYVLEGTTFDPSNRAAGVGARFSHPDHPKTRFDLYIYPAGQMEAGQAIEYGMQDFIGTFQYATAQGAYRDLEILDRTTFPLPLEIGEELVPHDPTDPLAEIVLASREKAIPGERLKLSMRHLPSNLPLQSRGYLFYRQMYYFKGRISAAEYSMDIPAFDALADDAMRTLVPAISALNVGSCATINVPVDDSEPDEEKRMQFGAIALVKGIARVKANNCTGELSTERLAELTANSEVVTIEFAPDEWSSP